MAPVAILAEPIMPDRLSARSLTRIIFHCRIAKYQLVEANTGHPINATKQLCLAHFSFICFFFFSTSLLYIYRNSRFLFRFVAFKYQACSTHERCIQLNQFM